MWVFPSPKNASALLISIAYRSFSRTPHMSLERTTSVRIQARLARSTDSDRYPGVSSLFPLPIIVLSQV